MPRYNISALKAVQDEIESRKSKLLQRFIPFRDGLLERLDQFTKEAVEKGLLGVKPCKRTEDSTEIIEVVFGLNGFDLALVAVNDALLHHAQDYLVSKMFIFFEGDEDNEATVEIVVRERNEEAYSYTMGWVTTEGPRPITDGCAVTKETGQEAAEALIGHFYRLNHGWSARLPTRRMILQSKGKSRGAIGFRSLRLD